MQVLDRRAALSIPPLWRLGFRPFFLGGALFALLAVALWGAALAGHPALQPLGGLLAWHRHEMLFGFGLAIIAGFLLTAVQTWTGLPSLSGRPLMALFGAWAVGRLAWFLPLPVVVLALLQLVFAVALVLAFGRMILKARQKHNAPIVVVLALLGACQALTLYGLAAGDDGLQRRGVLAALWLVAALMGIIGGRVIPFFTQRGLGLDSQAPAKPWLMWSLLAGSLGIAALFALDPGQQPRPLAAPLFLLVAGLHVARLWLWYHPGIWRVPLLWSLHLAYAWMAVAALGMALWHLGLLRQPSLASHALAVGAMGGLILAMLARVSLGHTGRPLTPPRAMAWAFTLLHGAALSRVLLAGFSSYGLWLAAAGWCLAFALFLRYYAAMFWSARVDGHPG
ncbi:MULTISPECIES: NnrS family protein [unclassified Pseudomonas]|uniref:NnrS family protein n=1 Tax=unclassified Pseudomonas TaxID=196821 RepID=UPI00244A48D1|nr:MULTISPECIES: NnrS family protein [unclassified Pseudomonas]MDG9930960.1 NnrS family protein [Pseudomonas sp. GD04042]MDH0484115.1 NnrS family protein [Pseudomonas sp. GD04015]MDH0605688.1 NnrS family protein [Pseudomonas sp. GD03869]